MDDQEKIKKALLKKALGYNADEVVTEYAFDEEGGARLLKKKVTKKHYSPDVSAVKVLLEKYYRTYEDEVASMSDEDLISEKERLKMLIKGGEDGDRRM